MKIDVSYRAASAVQTSLRGWLLLLAVGLALLAVGLYLVLSDFGGRRSGYSPLLIWSSCLPLLMRNTLDGPSVLTVSFVPALFSYQRGFVFKAARIRNIDQVRVKSQTFEIIRKNGTSFSVPRSEFPEVDFEALAQRLEGAARTHTDMVWFFQMNSVSGFCWIDPAIPQPASDKQKKMSVVFFAFLTLAFTAWAFYILTGR